MTFAILLSLFSLVPSEVVARTLLEPQCGRFLIETVRDVEDPAVTWAPPMRVSPEEAAAVRRVGHDFASIEAFFRALFPAMPTSYENRWERYFLYLWQRLPEVTVTPPTFSRPVKARDVVQAWMIFEKHLIALAEAPPPRHLDPRSWNREPRIKFSPAFRERIAALDPKVRRRIETTPFEAKAIQKTLAMFDEERKAWTKDEAARVAYRRLWQRVFQVKQPDDFELVRSGDGAAILAETPGEFAAGRFVEQFRLFKMVYNRNRPPGR